MLGHRSLCIDHRSFPLSFLSHLLTVLVLSACTHAATAQEMSFDIPAIAIAQQLQPQAIEQPLMGGKLVRIRVPVSIFVAQGGKPVSEAIISLTSPYRSMRILDFSPKTRIATQVDGSVAVKRSELVKTNAGAKGGFSFQPAGTATLETGVQNSTTVERVFQEKPDEHVVASSGTIDRGFGVFFKFRSGPGAVLEGVHEIAILAEVPTHWRADMLAFSMTAMGSGSARGKVLSESRMWSVIYQEGDQAAAAQARRYIIAEQTLRGLAASQHQRIREIAHPNVFHKIGSALDLFEPRVAQNFLPKVIFAMKNQYYDNAETNRLPVDVRIAILDYWDERERLVEFSRGGYQATDSATQLTRNTSVRSKRALQ